MMFQGFLDYDPYTFFLRAGDCGSVYFCQFYSLQKVVGAKMFMPRAKKNNENK